MKKCLFIFLVCVFYSISSAATINTLVIFGDSLSDNGNLFKKMNHLIPKSPPYYNGRFSNGPVWSELLGNYFKNKNSATIINYAIGGALITYHQLISHLHPILNSEINRFLAENLRISQDQTLYTVWMGGNDYIDMKTPCDIEYETTQITQALRSNLEILINKGAKHFLIFNLPDLARTPIAFTKSPQDKLNLKRLIQRHNDKLLNLIHYLRSTYPTLHIIYYDIYSNFEALFKNPIEFSQQYNLHISDVENSCWHYSYFLRRQLIQQNERVEKQMANLNINNLLDSTDIAETMQLSYQSPFLIPCNNPEKLAFWDKFHPTAAVHQIIARAAIKTLQEAREIN